jgi:hypothetical protein
MPNEIILKALSYSPDSVRALRVVSCELDRTGQDFLQWNRMEIASLCTQEISPLYSQIRSRLISGNIRPYSTEDRSEVQFHLSIPHTLWSFGVPVADCPERILSSGEISRFNNIVQGIQDANLQRIWDPIREKILATGPQAADIPESNAAQKNLRKSTYCIDNQIR